MLVGLFKTNRVYIYAFIIVALLLFRMPTLLSEPQIEIDGYLPPVEALFEFIIAIPWLSYLLSIFLITWQGFIVSRICDEYRLLGQTSNLTAFVLILFYSIQFHLNWISPALVASSFLLLAWKSILSIYNQANIHSIVFRTGVYIGLASLFYFPSFVMLFVLFYSLSVFRTFNWREYLIPVVGVISIAVYLFVYFWLTDNFIAIEESFVKMERFYVYSNPVALEWALYITFLLFAFISFADLLISNHTRTVRVNNLYRVLTFFPILVLLLASFYRSDHPSLYTITVIPIAIVFANFLLHMNKKWIAEAIAFIFVFLILMADYNLIP